MKIIKKLSELIECEIDDAERYVELALELRDTRKGLADTFYSLSLEEMKHMEILHEEVVKLIEEHRSQHGEPPADMLAIYEYLHKRHIKEAQEVKNYQTTYRES